MTVGTFDVKTERDKEDPQMNAEQLNYLQASLDASNPDMKQIRKVGCFFSLASIGGIHCTMVQIS